MWRRSSLLLQQTPQPVDPACTYPQRAAERLFHDSAEGLSSHAFSTFRIARMFDGFMWLLSLPVLGPSDGF